MTDKITCKQCLAFLKEKQKIKEDLYEYHLHKEEKQSYNQLIEFMQLTSEIRSLRTALESIANSPSTLSMRKIAKRALK